MRCDTLFSPFSSYQHCIQKQSRIDDTIMSSKIEIEIESFVMGYHAYRFDWKPRVGTVLEAIPEPTNPIDKYAVCMLLGDKVVGHLKRGKSGRFAKTISYFLQADPCSSCRVIIKGKAVNLGDGEGMQVPCKLMISQWSRQICNSLTKRTGQPRATIADYRSWRTIFKKNLFSDYN